MRFNRSKWFQCLFGAGLIAGWPRPLRAVAHLAMLVVDAGLFMLFAMRVNAAPAYAPVVAFFFVRMLYSAGRMFGGEGDAGNVLVVFNAVRSEAKSRED